MGVFPVGAQSGLDVEAAPAHQNISARKLGETVKAKIHVIASVTALMHGAINRATLKTLIV